MEELEKFKQLFWDAFHRPKLNTRKFEELFLGLESLNDTMAGPLFAVYSNGNCDYIFSDKQRFPGIKDADDFLDFVTGYVHQYLDAVKNTEAANEEESEDRKVLLYQTDLKMELSQLAYEIQKKRINPPDKE